MAIARHIAVKVSQRSPLAFWITRAPFNEQTDCQAPKHTKNQHGVWRTHSASVFIGRHIQTLVCAIFNSPILAISLQPLSGIHLIGRPTADQIDRFGLMFSDFPVHAGRLRREWKTHRLRIYHFAAQITFFPPTPIPLLAARTDERTVLRGKKPPGWRQTGSESLISTPSDCF